MPTMAVEARSAPATDPVIALGVAIESTPIDGARHAAPAPLNWQLHQAPPPTSLVLTLMHLTI
jgi:hypothetical protein